MNKNLNNQLPTFGPIIDRYLRKIKPNPQNIKQLPFHFWIAFAGSFILIAMLVHAIAEIIIGSDGGIGDMFALGVGVPFYLGLIFLLLLLLKFSRSKSIIAFMVSCLLMALAVSVVILTLKPLG